MPLSSTMKCVLLWTMSGTDNPADRYLPVSSATCNSLVVIIGPPKKWNLCSILSLWRERDGLYFDMGLTLYWFSQKKSTLFYMRLTFYWFSKEVDFVLYETYSLLVFIRSRLCFIWDLLSIGFHKKSTLFYMRLTLYWRLCFIWDLFSIGFHKKSTLFYMRLILYSFS